MRRVRLGAISEVLRAMSGNATGWFLESFGSNAGAFGALAQVQQTLQNHFAAQLPAIQDRVTRRVVKKGIYRVGKMFWGTGVTNNSTAWKFAKWTKTRRTSPEEVGRTMNCWEVVLYLAYQSDLFSQAGLVRYYQAPPEDGDQKLRSLFGTQQVYGPMLHTPRMGDLLTFVNLAGGKLDHVGIYVGVYNGDHYLLHNLKFNPNTQVGTYGCLHFEKMNDIVGRYVNGVTVYYNQPFWEKGAPSNTYYKNW